MASQRGKPKEGSRHSTLILTSESFASRASFVMENLRFNVSDRFLNGLVIHKAQRAIALLSVG
jgi:hypothetical protein